jgi:hypothetical protein
MAASDELELLERQGWDALSGPDGAAFYERVLADDGVMVFPGTVMDRAAALEAIRTVEPWSRFSLSDIGVVSEGPLGVVVYRARAQRGDAPEYEALMSSVYLLREGQWRLVLHQQSP